MPVQMMMRRAQPGRSARREGGHVAEKANGKGGERHVGLNSEANVRAGR